MKTVTYTRYATRPLNCPIEVRAIIDVIDAGRDSYILYRGADLATAERIAAEYRAGKWCNVARGRIDHLDIDVYEVRIENRTT